MKTLSEPRVLAGGEFLPRVLDVSRQAATATGASYQTLYTLSIPANTLGTGRMIRAMFDLRQTTGTGGTTIRLTYGATAVVTQSLARAGNRHLIVKLWGDNATNAQRGSISDTTAAGYSVGTATEDSTGALNFVLSMDLTTDTDVYTLDNATVEVLE